MAISIFRVAYYLLTLFSYRFFKEEQQFRNFIEVYNKSYTFGSDEYWHRFSIFQSALEKINHLNSQRKHSTSATFGLTPFADLTFNEFKKKVINLSEDYRSAKSNRKKHKRLLNLGQPELIAQSHLLLDYNAIQNLSHHVDWRSKGIIGDVIAQGKCGSCWAHTVVDTISSMVALQTGQKFVKLSAQQLLDCSDNNYGCNGGDLCETLTWLIKNDVHLLTDKEYPLRLDSGPCRQPKPLNGVQIHSNFTCKPETGHEENMLQLIANHGPLMVAADASYWQYYVNGTIFENCGNEANHAVEIVGYSLKDDIPYYIVRNTWGTDWGMDGYLQIAIGNNTCDITAEVATVWTKL